jgi:perosamine synthetase
MPKIITTGQGGMILTNDDSLADKIRLIKDFGRVGGGLDIHDVIGYNFKFTDLQATLGLSQFSQLPSRIKRKREIFDLYNKYLCNVDSSHLELLSNDLNYTTPWFYEILVEKRDALKNYLRELNIGTREMYPPINKQNAYNQKHIFPVSENIGKKGLWLPSYVQLTDEDVATICKHILEFTNF